MELGKYKLAMRPKKYLTREFIVYKETPEAMDDVITEEQDIIETMPSQAPGMDNVMPSEPGMEDPRLRQIALADGGTAAGKKTEKITRVGKPVYETSEGEMVSEQSRTLKLGNLYYNVPSIHDGKKYTDEQLVELLDKNLISPTSVHSNLEGAEDAAKFRSSTLFDTEEDYGQQLSAREGSFADGGIVEREGFKFGTKADLPSTFEKTGVTMTVPKGSITVQEFPKETEEILKKLNPTEKQTISKFGKLSMGFDPTDVLKTLPEKEVEIIKKAMGKLGNVAKLGATGLQELTVGTGFLGLGITAALTAPILVNKLGEGYSLGQSLQDVGNVVTFDVFKGLDVDRSMIKKYGGETAAEGYDIKKLAEEMVDIENKLLQLQEEKDRFQTDPKYAKLMGKEELFRINRRTKVLSDELADKQKQYDAIPNKFEKYTDFINIQKLPEEEKKIRQQQDKIFEPFSTDETYMEFQDPRDEEKTKQFNLKKEKLKEQEYKKKAPSMNFIGIPIDDIINRNAAFAYGGRVGLKDAGDPKDKPILPINPMIGGEDPRGSLQDPGRRDVLKGMGLLGAGAAAAKLGLLKLGKAVKKAKLVNVVKPMGATITKFPKWFPSLINRFRKEGKQIPIFKEIEVPLTEAEYNKLSKEGAKRLQDHYSGRTENYIQSLKQEGKPRYTQIQNTDEIIGYEYQVKDLPGTLVREMDGQEITVYFPNAYGRNVEMKYTAPKVTIDTKGKKVKYDAEFEVNDAVPEMAGPEDVPDFFPGIVDNLDDVYGGASKIEQYAIKAKQPRTTLGDEVVNRWDAGQPSMTVKELKETRKQKRREQGEAKVAELGKPSAFDDTEFLKNFYKAGDDFD